MAYLGADTAELDRAAADISRAAQQLETIRTAVSRQLGGLSSWEGSDRLRFQQRWSGDTAPQLTAAAAGLNEAAATLRRNAAEQRAASTPGTPAAADPTLDRAFALNNLAGTIHGLYETFTRNPWTDTAYRPISTAIGGITGIVGLFDAGKQIYDGIQGGNGIDAVLGSLNLGGTAAGFVSKLGPLGIAVGVFTTFVDATIPTSADDYDGMRAAGSRSAFGKDPQDLTDAQRRALDHRYDGPLGVAHMISDQMDSTADKVGKFFSGMFGG